MSRCQPCESLGHTLDETAIRERLAAYPAWRWDPTVPCLKRSIRFEHHHALMAFLNALAWVSHTEHHHPEVCFGYREATVSYHTHALGGVTDNDFICVTAVEALLA